MNYTIPLLWQQMYESLSHSVLVQKLIIEFGTDYV